MSITPFAWKDKPSLIERVFPAQKISAEAQKERKAGSGQTLTALGSYWKGRKPLILNRACILGALLPCTEDPEKDLVIFEKLMAIDDAILKLRARTAASANSFDELPYVERLKRTLRPEQCDEDKLLGPLWKEINEGLGTEAFSLVELVRQLGILRFGSVPRVADVFCGSGQIPFEAARLGCDVYASDLNPVACLLTWGALTIVGASEDEYAKLSNENEELVSAVNDEIEALQFDRDSAGNRAKSYLYCLETRCPQTGWLVPLSASWVVSVSRRVIARLNPDHKEKRFEIEVIADASDQEMNNAQKGTIQNGELVYSLDDQQFRTSIKTIRGDYRLPSGEVGNKLRRWGKGDIAPQPDDVFQERLYAIHWISAESEKTSRQETFFTEARDEDLERENQVKEFVQNNLSDWQQRGLIPSMPIESGDKTDEPIRTRGWTYWHHLFSPRHLLLLATFKRNLRSPHQAVHFASMLDYTSKLCRWTTSGKRLAKDGSDKQVGGASDNPSNVFYNQALNTFYNYGERASAFLLGQWRSNSRLYPLPAEVSYSIRTAPADQISEPVFIGVTDPPYADAVRYHEITEFFISWLRGSSFSPLDEWIWDSRRALAIKGSDEDFRREMISAYKALAENMPDNGLQVVMFTHQDASVWSDMTSIVWGAGLRVTAAWYIATETTSELKKGGYVQGTVLLILRKRLDDESIYRDELVEEVRKEVANQIETMTGLNQQTKGHGRTENLFEDADLQMAGYAAALRVLTGYRKIDGQDMAAEALRPRQKGERDIVKEIIDYAVMVANEHLVPDGLSPAVWERCTGVERFYLKMLDIESAGLKKLDNYQNFAKAFRVADYGSLMASMKANSAKLKNAKGFKKSQFEGDFGKSSLRALLFAIYEIQQEIDTDEVMGHLRDLVPGYLTQREHLISICQYIIQKREEALPDEAAAARVLLTRIRNERLGD